MAKADERGLRARLARVEALHRRATTPGERAAAGRARERLVEHLVRLRADDPVVAFVREHLAELLVDEAPPPPPARLPSAEQVTLVLREWERGTRTSVEVAEWAAEQVDVVDLPADPRARGAVIGEVLLQLSASARPSPGLIPAVEAFLASEDWAAWFAVVAREAVR
jgi:hypothetical protein